MGYVEEITAVRLAYPWGLRLPGLI